MRMMHFEDYIASWQNQDLEGYLFESPPSVLAAEVRRAAGEIQQRNLRRDTTYIGILTVLIVTAVVALIFERLLLARAGTILLAAGLILELRSFHRLHVLERRRRFDLPRKRYLIEARKRITEQIRQMKRQTSCYAGFLLIGMALLCAAWGCPANTVRGFVAGESLAAVSLYILQLRRIRKAPLPALAEIDRTLARYDVIAD
jgi:hypothetical protein